MYYSLFLLYFNLRMRSAEIRAFPLYFIPVAVKEAQFCHNLSFHLLFYFKCDII